MKVLVVSSKYPPEYSGSGLRAHRTYLRLSEKYGIDFDVLCSSTGAIESERYEIDGATVERIVSRRTRLMNRKLAKTRLRRVSNAVLAHVEARLVRRALRERSFDLIHTFGYSPATTAAIKWSRDRKIPLILELVNPVATPYQYLPGTRYFNRYDLADQSFIVAISEDLGEMCRRLGLADNVWVRPNPVDTGIFGIPTESVRRAAREKISSADESDVLIVYVAKYIARKNHAFLLDVLAKLPKRFRLVLAGPPLTDRDLVPGLRADQIPTLRQRAEELGVSDRVDISHGFVEMAEYLSAADVFCFPAEREAMGTPMLESISTGVPVVANADESSFQEWVVEGENGFLRSLEPTSWAPAIIKASTFDESKRSAMSEAIKNAISTDSIDDNYRKLLESVASSTPGQVLNVWEVLS